MYGWRGKILRVDLANARVFKEDLDAKAARDFIGARGLAASLAAQQIEGCYISTKSLGLGC